MDRCQYFEAHGTGTKAGDPQEAAAIHRAFFRNKDDKDPDDVLYVGSIKTVIGHTEGTAGIAGLLKASLSLQTATLFPNMLFEELNPDLDPYYGNLQILTSAKPWPTLPPGVPRRASVNSFGECLPMLKTHSLFLYRMLISWSDSGFGGANAHAILESYEPASRMEITSPRNSLTAIPFLFSANSEKALAVQIETYLTFLNTTAVDGSTVNLRDLAWTLSRRSAFSLRAYCSATSSESLRTKLAAMLEAKKSGTNTLGIRPSHKTQTLFGVFTGQGAQWARMGYMLIEASPLAETWFQELDDSLQSLPVQDRPLWHVQDELAKSTESSRVMGASYSQPLCTAVQIVLVKLLAHSGVTFDAVVGHSSGEIAAAYAAGFLTAPDAIRIAYYRGLYGHSASGPGGIAGAMLAVGTSVEDATELCELPTMARHGRFVVAAINSSASVTLSGDQKAIDRAKFILEDEKKFVRALKVDTAYHSHHMQPCEGPYMEAMARVAIQIHEPMAKCRWFSSVQGGVEVTSAMKDQLRGPYWRDNLLQPVLFSQAVETALEAIGKPALVVEVGAHPALQGPASLVIEEKIGTSVPYSGVLARGSHDVEAFSNTIGAIWSHVGTSVLKFNQLDGIFRARDVHDAPSLLKDAPRYTWDHSSTYWAESRISRALRLRPQAHNELLGVRLDSGENEFRWRNLLKLSELPWVKGHQIQGQTIFPGAGFAAMAIEACRVCMNPDSDTGGISWIELQDLTIRRAVSFQDENIGVESIVTLNNIDHDDVASVVQCDFVCEMSSNPDAPLRTASTARISLRLGGGSSDTLPARTPWADAHKMTDVDSEVFYKALAKIGYNYSESFAGITGLQRATGKSSGTIHVEPFENTYDTRLFLHPAPLDVAFQGIFAAIGSPGDGQLWTLMVPTAIRSVRINLFESQQTACLGVDLAFDASVAVGPSTHDVYGDVDVFHTNGSAILQIEGLHVTPVAQVTAKDDAQKISEQVWGFDRPNAAREYCEFWDTMPNEQEMAHLVERACFFYMKMLHEAITVEEREGLEPHLQRYLRWIASVIEEATAGTHPTIRQEWLHDTPGRVLPWLTS